MLSALHDHHLTPHGITFDGATCNKSAVEILGGKLDPNNLQHFFMFQPRVKDASIPVLAIKIYLFLDVPHMLKLARNLLHDWKEISVPGFQKPACWKFIQLLYEYQMEIGLRAYGNRLTNKHIYFDRYKMKVALAAQVLSSSVADTLDYLREELKLTQFQESAATAAYCRMFNDGFDILNSSNPVACDLKSSLTI